MMGERWTSLLDALKDAERLLILAHNDPDPDALASAAALQYLVQNKLELESRILYRGIIGRAENRAMVRYLGCPLRRLLSSDLRRPAHIALVDTQPGTGNNALPPDRAPNVVLDHHSWREATAEADFYDIRVDVGASSTMLTEYLLEAGIEPTPSLATALFYGIKTDTMGLARGTHKADVAAYLYLQPRVDIDALAKIERAQVPPEYFANFVQVLRRARIYDNVVISYMGNMAYPDLAAEMADLLLRLKGVEWVICMGVYRRELILSVRRLSPHAGASRLVQDIVRHRGSAGGHGMMAGGQVPLNGQDPDELAATLERLALRTLGIDPQTASQSLLG